MALTIKTSSKAVLHPSAILNWGKCLFYVHYESILVKKNDADSVVEETACEETHHRSDTWIGFTIRRGDSGTFGVQPQPGRKRAHPAS